jgi:hypothetical protein
MPRACADFLFASTIFLGQPIADAQPHTGARTMSHTPEQVAFLERFNQPELFLADAKNLDLQQIVWEIREKEAVFTRSDGVKVRIMKDDGYVMEKKGMYYLEDLTYPASPYAYTNIYDEHGILLYKFICFYGADFSKHECKDGKCVMISPPRIPITQARAMLQKETGIDLYDKSIVSRADYLTDGKTIFYFVLTMRNLRREMLIDATTGKELYKREFIPSIEGSGSIPGKVEMEGSAAYLKSVKIVKKLMEKNQTVYEVYKKHSTRDPDRFYEILLQKPFTEVDIPIVSLLLDHKKEKVLYRCETAIRHRGIHLPYIELLDEYQQHLKMREAEEEKPEKPKEEKSWLHNWFGWK